MQRTKNLVSLLAITFSLMLSADPAQAQCVEPPFSVFAYVMSPEARETYRLPKNGSEALTASCASRESSNPYADGLTNDDPGIVS